jgi:hypothetical protein
MKYGMTALATLALVAACGGSDGGGGGGATTTAFSGIVSSGDGSASGSISVSVKTTSPIRADPTSPALVSVEVSGTLHIGGSTITLSGTYDTESNAFSVSGGGYTFDGVFDGVDRLEGTWTGPGGTSGTFVATLSSTASAFCGHYAADDQSDNGTFSFVTSGSILRGEAVSSVDHTNIALDGTVNGNDLTIFFPGTTTPLATGLRNGTGVSGHFDDQQGTTGSWSGSVSECQ